MSIARTFLHAVIPLVFVSFSGCATVETPSTASTVESPSTQDPKLDAFLEAQMAKHKVPGLSIAVIKDGKIAYTRQMGVTSALTKVPVNAKTTFEAASLSKPLFAFFVMSFVEAGQLDLDRPLYEYLPYSDLAHDERYKKITARMVLTHRTGLPNWRSETKQARLSLSFDPGSAFQYSGEGYQYLALVLAKIANTDARGLEMLFHARIAVPLRMTQSRFMPDTAQQTRKAAPHRDGQLIAPELPKPNVFGAAYSVETDAVDLAKWTVGMLNNKVLSQLSYEHFFAPQKAPIPANHPQRPFGLVDWALGFSVFETPAGRLYTHGGNNVGYTSAIAFNRERGWGFVVLTNSDQATPFVLELFSHLVRANMK